MASRATNPKKYGLPRAAQTCAWGLALVVLMMSTSADAQTQLTFYQNQQTFDAAYPGLPVEGFEQSLVPQNQQQNCDGPFNSQTNNECFAPGAILEDISLDALQLQGDGQMAVTTSPLLGLGSDVVGTNTPFDNLGVFFPSGVVFAVGMELLSPITGPFTVTIEIYGVGEDNFLGQTEMRTGGAQGVFWGVSSDVPIDHIVFLADINQDVPPQLMVDNIAFGGAPLQQLIIQNVTPTAVQTLGLGGSVNYTITVVDPQNSPVAGARVRIDDQLLGGSITVGDTDGQGQTFYQTVVPDDKPGGVYTLTFIAEHPDFDDSNPVTRQVEVQRQTLIIQSITPTDVQTLGIGELVIYTITVADPENNPLLGAQVLVNDGLLNGVLTVGNTNNQGQINYQTVVPENTPGGFYDITFVAQHDEFDDSEPVVRQVEVQLRKLAIDVTPTAVQTLDIGGAVTYTSTVVDPQNNPVAGARIRIDDELRGGGVTIGNTDNQGQIDYQAVVPEDTPEGSYDITFIAEHDEFDDSDPVMRQVEVEHRAPGLQVTPGTVDFGDVLLGQLETETATLSNTGDAQLNVQAIRITGTDASDFSLEMLTFPIVIPPGGSTTVNVGFAPSARGVRNAVLEVDSDGGNTTNPMTGEGTAPGINVEPASVDYGRVDFGAFADETVVINNTGNAALSLEALQVVGPNEQAFSIVSGGEARVLGIGDEHEVIVRFAPSVAGIHDATLEISSDAVAKTALITAVPLTGEGALAALEVTPETVAFGALIVGTPSDEQTVSARNTGNVALTLQIEISGNDADAFAIVSGGSGGVLNPSDPPHDIVLQYTPTLLGMQRAELQIRWDGVTTVVTMEGEGFDVMLSPPQESGPAERDQALVVGVAVPDGFTPTSQQLFFRRGGETAYQQIDLQDAANGGLEGAIPAAFVTERGVEYYVRLSDDMVTVTFPEEDPEGNPVRLRVLVAQIDAGGMFRPEIYRMVSAPLEWQDPSIQQLVDDYGPFDPTQWRALRWRAVDGVYVEAGVGAFLDVNAFTAGQAFWLINRAGGGFDLENGRSTDTSEPYTIDLRMGAHQIGNPFAFPVAVSSITNIDDLQGPFSHDGTEYMLAQTVLLPWEGYFVRNLNSEIVRLSVSPVEAVAAPKQAQPAALFPDADFMLQLRAEIPGLPFRDTQNYIGFAEQATARPHTFNLIEPPPIGDHLRLSILEGGQRYFSYFKPGAEEGRQWDFEITLVEPRFEPRSVQVALVEHGLRPEGFDLYVFDRDLGRVLPVEGGLFRVDLTREHPVRHLSLVLGTTSFAEAHSEGASLVPVEFFLTQNYPNPFNPETVIRYGLDQQSPVVLAIYNMLGQQIRTLVQAEQASGWHEVVWNGLDEAGRPAASGLYVYQLRAGAFIASRKMLLLR